MCRLTTLLSRFQLPPVATAAELRRAYLREAKRLHPDCNPQADRASAAHAFVRLKADFEEASGLLERAGATVEQQVEFNAGWQRQPHPTGWSPHSTGWTSSGWAADSAASRMEAEARASRDAVPTVGLSPNVVYPAAAALSVSALLTLFLRSDSNNDNNRPQPTVSMGRGFKLRHALEQDDNSTDVSSDENMPTKLDGPLVDERFGSAAAAHEAASKGRVWWIERCGASPTCRVNFDTENSNGDTPLHHCARGGQKLTCQTLLRLGVDPVKRNRWGLTPEHLAHYSGHGETASLIRGVRQGTSDACRAADRHPDGFGLLARQKWDVAGQRSSESLRHATNMAAGCSIVSRSAIAAAAGALASSQPAPQVSPAPSGGGPAEHVSWLHNVASTTEAQQNKEVAAALAQLSYVLNSKGYTLQGPVLVNMQQAKGDFAEREEQMKRWWTHPRENTEVCGLLVYEAPGLVTSDAPGHWVAVRHDRQRLETKAQSGHTDKSECDTPPVSEADFLRLDPVRGPFRMTSAEMADMLWRYCAWQLVRQPAEM